ncbi:unnamed protein product [Notodromas monacha]|uniref:PDZ domain-containing protein n=1 Tax=Notodromas monacha TaxID=399045 RepID=A0A7R9C033_9CRUS|nr:unnamed protein product [Notodromas monacha]CAG0923511.1 unnamed protein product [Notodromas monacha]
MLIGVGCFPVADFGVVLGCKIYVKEVLPRSIADKEGGLREGDVLTKINAHSTENMTLKEARKLVDSAKDKLHLIVRRDKPSPTPALSTANQYENQKDVSECNRFKVLCETRNESLSTFIKS